MNRGLTGRYETSQVGGEQVRAFIPNPLPPIPSLDLTGTRQILLEHALLALGRLDSVSTLLPDPHLFLYSYVRKEALLSSQIEGTQSSLSDLLLFELEEAPGVPQDEVTDVSNYVAALEYGLERLREGFPLSNRLIREVHAQLLSRGRGSDKLPGEFRRSQNWIGGTRPGNAHFVPPPHQIVEDCMGQLEQFLHDETIPLPMLAKAALAHVQFETVHPFLDGNGRVTPMRQRFRLEAERLGRRFVFTQLFANAQSFHFRTFADAQVFHSRRLQTAWYCLKNWGLFENSLVDTGTGCLHMTAIFKFSARAQSPCEPVSVSIRHSY